MQISRFTKLFVCAALAAFLLVGSATAQPGGPFDDKCPPGNDCKFPIDDLVVRFSFGSAAALIEQFENASFAFKYIDNGVLCSSPYVSIALPTVRIETQSILNLLTGSARTTLGAKVRVHFEVSQCTGLGTLKLDVVCSSHLPMNNFGGELVARSFCRFDNGNIFDILFWITTKTRIPVELPRVVRVQLKDPPPLGDLHVNFQFTEFKNGNWVPLRAPHDRTKEWPLVVNAIFGGGFPFPIVDPRAHSPLGRDLVLAGTISHPRRFGTTKRKSEALAENFPTPIFANLKPPIMIRIKESLIAPPWVRSPQDPRYGILGGLFPLKITALYEPSPSVSIGVEVDIGSLTFRIHQSGLRPQFEVALNVDNISVINRKDGTALVGKLSTPSVVVAGPTIDVAGRVRFDLSKLDLTIESQLGANNIAVSLGEALRGVINENMPYIAQISPSFTAAVPECIPAENRRVRAERPCSEYNGETEGYMQRTTAASSKTVRIDFSKTEIYAQEGEVHIYLME